MLKYISIFFLLFSCYGSTLYAEPPKPLIETLQTQSGNGKMSIKVNNDSNVGEKLFPLTKVGISEFSDSKNHIMITFFVPTNDNENYPVMTFEGYYDNKNQIKLKNTFFKIPEKDALEAPNIGNSECIKILSDINTYRCISISYDKDTRELISIGIIFEIKDNSI